MNKYNLKLCETKDYEFIYNLKKDVYKKYVELYWNIWDEDIQRKHFEKFINTYKDNLYIIQINNIDIGFINYEIIDENTCEFGNICILPKYQNQGIGSLVLNDFLNKYNDKDIKLQYFKSNPIENLYIKLGFEKIGETEYHYQMIKYKKK